MVKTAQYVLGELKPDVFWGENAPGFAGKDRSRHPKPSEEDWTR
jgi:hypothetical protein